MDAYHDVCGEAPNTGPCFNTFGGDSGSYEDETSQVIVMDPSAWMQCTRDEAVCVDA